MTKEELINYWVTSSENDYETMLNLYNINEYSWSLFIGHIVIEKLLKAYYVKTIDNNPPFSHNLIFLLEKSDLLLSESQKDDLTRITTFNIFTRYPDYKQEFYKKCTS